MEKILLKKITFNFIIVGSIIVSLLSLIIYNRYTNLSFIQSDQLIEQVENSYAEHKRSLNRRLDIYKEDYLNRVYATEFILKNNIKMRSKEGLNEIKELMNINSIYVIDKSGEVILTTEEVSMGLNLLEHEESSTFWSLIKGSSQNDYVIDLYGRNIRENIPRSFIGVKSSVDDYSIVQIGMDRNFIAKVEDEESISSLLNDTPSTYDNTIFAMDRNSGEILGITKNNEQNINFDQINSTQELITLLENSSEGDIIKINGSKQLLKSKVVDDIILVSFFNAKSVYNQVFTQIIYCVVIVFCIIFIMMLTLKKYFRKFVFDDFKMIENGISKMISGDLDICFETKNPDLKSLVNTLNYWKNSNMYKNSRMTKIISSIDSNIGLFECLYFVQQNFYSDNVQSILGIDDNKWNEIKASPKLFERYIKDLIKLENNDGIICLNDRYFVIKSYTVDNEFFGIIIDKSDEIKNNEQKIKKLKLEAERDNLTNLLNRNAFTKYVKNSLLNKPTQGTMLIFDLDNFKQINDKLGHPEGDKVLKLVSSCLKDGFRISDFVGRLGGDEFVVFIDYNIPIQQLDTKVKSLLDDIRKKLSYYYDNYNVSVSVGVAYVDNKTNEYNDLYIYADAALYVAKRLGKDTYYINEDNIRCMRNSCINCTNDCTKKKLLGL